MAASRLERLLQRQSSRMTGRHEQVPRGHVGGDCDQGAVLSQHRTEQARFHHVVLGLRLARRRQKLAVLPLVDLHIFTLLDVPLVHGPDPVWSALQSQGHPTP